MNWSIAPARRHPGAVLVANALPFLNPYDTEPLIWPVLYKSVFYFVIVFVVRLLEKVIEYAVHGGTAAGLSDYVTTHFTWHRLFAIQTWDPSASY